MTNRITPFDHKVERLRKRIKIKEVAEYMECSPSLVSRWENDYIHFTSDKIAMYTYFINTYQENK